MGLWSRWVFPRLCHLALAGEPFVEHRRRLLAGTRGRVLELGLGSGLNLPLYPQEVERVDGVEPNPGMHALARKTLAGLGGEGGAPARGPEVELHLAYGEELPFDDGVFDCAVSTWTLCSVADPSRVLAEVARVLRPGGRLLYLEHGLSPEPRVARWQRRLGPVQRRLADGCHLDRDLTALVAASPLGVESEDRFYEPKSPKVAGYHYRGTAVRAAG